jgi:molecular chaperone GrpE
MNTEQVEQNEPETAQVDVAAGTEAQSSENELEQLRGERDQLQDRLARLQAEFDNARKREIKERQDARDRAIQSAVEPFLGVMDNFALALKSDSTIEQLRAGVQLILKQMDEALRSLNVQPVESVGEQFDPRIHEALGSIETWNTPTTRSWKRFAAATSSATSSSARHWYASPATQRKQASSPAAS